MLEVSGQSNTTLGTQKFRNILLFEDPLPPHEFGNIDFGITRCFDSQTGMTDTITIGHYRDF